MDAPALPTPVAYSSSTERSPRSPATHVSSLDGLRFFAFLGVFLYHADERIFRFGRYGVQVFLVLSGFLIGNILLELRNRTEFSVPARLKLFYLRRSLRIFPVYYFLLLVILLLSILHVVKPRLEAIPFHALYLTNFYLVFTGAEIDSQTHLWSLSVEEQFYLLAPLVLLYVRVRYVGWACLCFVLLDFFLRLANFISWNIPRFEYVSPVQFDALGSGILAALLLRQRPTSGVASGRLRRAALVCGLGCICIVMASYWPGELFRIEERVLLPSLLAVAAAGLILQLWNGNFPRASAFFSWQPFAYLGKISYGLYLYHNFLFVLTRDTHGARHILALLVTFVATVAIASASWHILEQPLLKLRRHVEVDRRQDSHGAAFGTAVTRGRA